MLGSIIVADRGRVMASVGDTFCVSPVGVQELTAGLASDVGAR